ncbi:chromatin accessibility complex protein 1-like [Tropilaelaps mercedesae]|uniref:Chromatin accessibility complex protein 1-like n=1 Tax=Tropilaelaps mercedesae TaxID=418985 RepID=A0A1V9XNH0_9ACAR|nr:chromatin accessibility complex protein 1-like [Tropilaelaps mercedesae]
MQGGALQKKEPSGGGRKSTKDSKQTKDKEPKEAKGYGDAKPSKEQKTKQSKDHKNSLKEGGSKDSKESKTTKEKKEEQRSDSAKDARSSPHLKGPAGQESPLRKERVQAKASFPLTRIKMIMKSAPEVNTLGVDAVALTARAAELFVIHLAKETLKKGKSTKVEYTDIYKVVHDNPDLDFLYGKPPQNQFYNGPIHISTSSYPINIIPQKVPYKDCIAEMKDIERKQKEIMEQIEI